MRGMFMQTHLYWHLFLGMLLCTEGGQPAERRACSVSYVILMSMAAKERVPGWIRRTVIEVVGWTFVVLGIAALVLPGPGLLMLAAGLAVLSQQYHWARRYLRPLKANANHAAALGVKTIPRIVGSCLSALMIMSLGVLWILQPAPPAWWFLETGWWLFGGAGTGISLIVSSVIALVLIVYSVRRFRGRPIPPRPTALGTEADELH